MHKLYLLLRNNKQSGPYSLEELVQQGLKPFDLIWIEGKSCGWSYPSEVDILKPYLTSETAPAAKTERPAATSAPAAKQQQPVYTPTATVPTERAKVLNTAAAATTASKKVYVNMPKNFIHTTAVVEETLADDTVVAHDALERKAEELRRRVQAYAAEKKAALPQETLKAQLQETVKTKYAHSIDNVEEDYTSWINNKKGKKKTRLSKKKLAVGFIILFLSATSGYLLVDKLNTLRKASAENTAMQKDASTGMPAASAVQQTQPSETTANEHNSDALSNIIVAGQEENKMEKTTQAITGNLTNTADAEKKPPVGNKKDLTDIAGTVKKTNEPVKENAPVVRTNASEKNDAQADENYMYNTTANKASFLDVTTNKSYGNGKMGVKGLKVTVNNTGSENINRARVAVYYYNEQNQLLEKKLIYFRNIEPNKPITVPAPDHRNADHIDYHLVSVSN